MMAVTVIFSTACKEELDKDLFKYNVKPLAVSGVKVNKNELTLKFGEKQTLSATISPERATNKEFTWSSGNDKIVTVNSLGEVVAVGVGKASIIATSVDGAKTDECKVTVNPYVELNETKVTLLVGEKMTLKATVIPASYAQDVTWDLSGTDASKFVSVNDDGEVTGISNGKATVRATIPDIDPAIRASCEVTVGLVPVESVNLNEAILVLAVGESGVLSATVLPENAANKGIKWRLSNPVVNISIDETTGELTVTRVKEGDVVITVVTDDGGKTASCTIFSSIPEEYALFCGESSKTWEWEAFEWGNGRFGSGIDKDPWWKAEDFEDFFTDTYKSKEVGATMTFSFSGFKFVKTRTDGTSETGTFSLNNTKKKWDDKEWSTGQLATKDATIPWGRLIDISKVNDSEADGFDKKPKPGQYPNGEADIAKAYIFDVIKVTDDKMILAIPADGITGGISEWGGAWYWTFKPKP